MRSVLSRKTASGYISKTGVVPVTPWFSVTPHFLEQRSHHGSPQASRKQHPCLVCPDIFKENVSVDISGWGEQPSSNSIVYGLSDRGLPVRHVTESLGEEHQNVLFFSQNDP